MNTPGTPANNDQRVAPCALATACVPWNADESFCEALFRRHVRDLKQRGYRDLYVFGTAGEGYAVTQAQFRQVAQTFFEETADLPGLRQLGVIGLSTAQVRERIDIGMDLGFRDFQVSLPSWGALNNGELRRFFDDVLGAYPEARFLHYNNARCGRLLQADDYVALAARHPNLVATKSGGHRVADLQGLLNSETGLCHFVTEPSYGAACLLGLSCGLLVSVSAINPARSLAFFEAGQRRDTSALQTMMAELQPIRQAVLNMVMQDGAHMDGACDKLWPRLYDPEFPLRLLSPYQGASEAHVETLRALLAKRWPDWAPD